MGVGPGLCELPRTVQEKFTQKPHSPGPIGPPLCATNMQEILGNSLRTSGPRLILAVPIGCNGCCYMWRCGGGVGGDHDLQADSPGPVAPACIDELPRTLLLRTRVNKWRILAPVVDGPSALEASAPCDRDAEGACGGFPAGALGGQDRSGRSPQPGMIPESSSGASRTAETTVNAIGRASRRLAASRYPPNKPWICAMISQPAKKP